MWGLWALRNLLLNTYTVMYISQRSTLFDGNTEKLLMKFAVHIICVIHILQLSLLIWGGKSLCIFGICQWIIFLLVLHYPWASQKLLCQRSAGCKTLLRELQGKGLGLGHHSMYPTFIPLHSFLYRENHI